jgi:hypothetical protein
MGLQPSGKLMQAQDNSLYGGWLLFTRADAMAF